ncbi:hypothetical protein ACLMJK_002292 [Lecanora helva]
MASFFLSLIIFSTVLLDFAHGGHYRGQRYGLLDLVTNQCNESAANNVNQTTNLIDAFHDANTIASAGLVAAASPNSPPFNYFFHPSDNATVAHHLQTIIDITEHPSAVHSKIEDGLVPYIYVNCNDAFLCKYRNQWGYSTFWGKSVGSFQDDNWEITICNFGLNTLQRNPFPCQKSPPSPVGIPSLGWIAVKFLLQMWSMFGGIGDRTGEPANCHALLTDGGNPLSNAENYAYMASWAYDMGLKTDGPYYGPSCPERWNPSPQLVLPQSIQHGQSDLTSGGNGSASQ